MTKKSDVILSECFADSGSDSESLDGFGNDPKHFAGLAKNAMSIE